jgi:hypothetical protein
MRGIRVDCREPSGPLARLLRTSNETVLQVGNESGGRALYLLPSILNAQYP